MYVCVCVCVCIGLDFFVTVRKKEFSVTILVGELWEKGSMHYIKALLNEKLADCFHCARGDG